MLKLLDNELVIDRKRLQEVEDLYLQYCSNENKEDAKQLAESIPDLIAGLYGIQNEVNRIKNITRVVDGMSNSLYDLSKLSIEDLEELEGLLSKSLESVGSDMVN